MILFDSNLLSLQWLCRRIVEETGEIGRSFPVNPDNYGETRVDKKKTDKLLSWFSPKTTRFELADNFQKLSNIKKIVKNIVVNPPPPGWVLHMGSSSTKTSQQVLLTISTSENLKWESKCKKTTNNFFVMIVNQIVKDKKKKQQKVK